ncbi:MAG: MlaD family protein [Dissulfurispiraceae bacterium]|jgi:phospholipid/cholesterol/gamma-HCH transport system substrate-binding protein|nr:MlaD family protein [Dissulfurispiraceae bacterium]
MKILNKESKVGLFIIVVMLVVAFMTFKIGDFDFHRSGGYTIYIYFNNASGLDTRTKVRVSGVEAGVIQDIALVEERVRVKVRMYDNIKLLSDASASIKMAGMLGDKFLEITAGTQTPFLKDGDVINCTAAVTDIDGLIRNLAKVSIEITKLTENVEMMLGDEGNRQIIRELMTSLRDAGRNLNNAILNNDAAIKKTIESISELSKTVDQLVKSNSAALNSAISNMDELSSTLKNQTPVVLKNIDSAVVEIREAVDENRPSLRHAVDNLDKIINKIESGEGTAGKLIKDDSLYQSITKTSDKIQEKLSMLDSFRLYMDLKSGYITRHDQIRPEVSVVLRPDDTHYFILGAASDPMADIRGGSRDRKTTFTAQIGKRFSENDYFKNTVVRAGVIDSSVGIGMDQYLLEDRMRLYMDASRFSRDDRDSKNPKIRAGADYFIYRNIFISAGMDEIINSKRQSFFMGGGVRFGK